MGEIFTRIRRAAAGELRYAPAGSDVRHSESTDDVLRLKIGPRRTADNTKIHVRVYFTEPDSFPSLLLGLSVQAKHDGPVGKIEQNEHAAAAQQWCDLWHTMPRYG